MAARRLTVADLVAEVRSLLDEKNVASLDDETDILPALNRAQDYAANILARHYESPLLVNIEVPLVAGQQDYPIPEDAFEQRLEKVEVRVGTRYYEVGRVDYRDIADWDVAYTSTIPSKYCIIGGDYRILPAPSGGYSLRVWYLREPPTLVLPQGRITAKVPYVALTDALPYIYVDDVGSQLDVVETDLNNYVNFIDGRTGAIKATLQLQSINNKKLTFKHDFTGLRTTVLDRPVSDDIPPTVDIDDYICTVHGSCIPFFKKSFTNFLIEHAATELRILKFEGESAALMELHKSFEDQVERSWVGREQTLRVKRRSRAWRSSINRSFRAQ